MKAFLKLIRWQNLLIVILTMGLMRYALIESVLSKMSIRLYASSGTLTKMSLQSSWIDFLILVAATTLITAGGYVINDYFDIKTDLINRGTVIIGTRISRRQAMMWHNILNIAGVAGGFYVSAKAGNIWMGSLFLVVSGLLYFYSASYKRQFLIGNLLVAVLTAIVPFLVVLFEAPFLFQYYAINALKIPDLSLLFYCVGGFSIFAFLTTLSREIIKDIEDFEGDVAYGRNTLPVVIGILTSRIIAICLLSIIIVMLYLLWNFYLHDVLTFIYISVAIALPMVYVIYQIIVSQTRKQLHTASRIMRIIMLSGILYSIVVKIILTYNLG